MYYIYVLYMYHLIKLFGVNNMEWPTQTETIYRYRVSMKQRGEWMLYASFNTLPGAQSCMAGKAKNGPINNFRILDFGKAVEVEREVW